MKKKMTMMVLALISVCALGVTESEFSDLKKKAEGGDVEAMCEVGRCYRNGAGVERNDVLASKWTQKAASNGLSRATGLCYEFGYGVRTNAAEAVKWYQIAAERGDVASMRNIAHCYQKGVGVGSDEKMALEWYEKAAAKGDVLSMVAAGFAYQSGNGAKKDMSKAIALSDGFNAGVTKAMESIGTSWPQFVDAD